MGRPLVSVIIPVFNRAWCIRRSVESVLAQDYRPLELIVVDDGSRDDTATIVKSFSDVTYVLNEVNLGKGRSVRRGMLKAKYDCVLFSDVDLSTPIEESLELLRAIEGGADLVIASRVMSEKEVSRTFARKLMANVFRLLVKVIVLRGVYDTQCGFKMFRREVAREVFPLQLLDGWAFDVEVLFIAKSHGFVLREVPVEWHESEESRLSFWSPIQMLGDLFRIRFYHLLGRYRKRKTPLVVDGRRPS